MKKLILPLSIAATLLSACGAEKKATAEEEQTPVAFQYPETKKGTVEDTYFGTTVSDPYRWMEDDRSAETENWVKAQNKVTFDYLKSIPYREELKNQLEKVWNYEKISSPFKEGNYTYFYKNDGLQNQYVVYRKKEGEEKDQVFIDPNTFSKDGTVSMAGLDFSKDGSRAAYLISEGGSDWRKVIVIDTETNKPIEDTLKNVKFSGISWKGNDGFYYSSYDKPEGSELSAKTDQHKLYFHKVGTPQSEDKVIFGATADQKHRYVGGYLTEDEKYLLISASNSTSGNKLFMKDLSKKDAPLITIVDNEDSDTYLMTNEGSKLYLVTNLDAPNKRVVITDASKPTPQNWKDVIPHTKNVLNASSGGGYLFAEYMVDAISKVVQYDMNGKEIREIKLPGVGSAGGFGGKKEDKEMYFS